MASIFDFSSIKSVLRQRNFRIYEFGNVISLVGMWAQRIAVGWLAWTMTHSGTWLGVIAFADLFPTIILTPLAGILADRFDRLRMLVIFQGLAMVQAVALCALTVLDLIDIWSLLGWTIFLGTSTAFSAGIRLAVIPNLVERKHLTSAIAVNSAAFNIARFAGPAVGGVTLSLWDASAAFAFNAVSFLFFLAALLQIRLVEWEPKRQSRGSLFSDAAEALRYVRSHRGIGPMLLLITALAFSVKPFLELLPGISDAVFNRGPQGLAQLAAAAGFGAVSAALWLAKRGTIVGLTHVTVASIFVSGAALLAFVATDMFWLALPFASIAGAAMSVCGNGTQTVMQSAVDGAMRGRVMSLYAVTFRGGPALGAVFMGYLSDYIGLRLSLATGGVFCFVAGVWIASQTAAIATAIEGNPE
ncbi:MAG: MFS transporter [Alphaproteobacteria bacterium]